MSVECAHHPRFGDTEAEVPLRTMVLDDVARLAAIPLFGKRQVRAQARRGHDHILHQRRRALRNGRRNIRSNNDAGFVSTRTNAVMPGRRSSESFATAARTGNRTDFASPIAAGAIAVTRPRNVLVGKALTRSRTGSPAR